MSYRINEVTYFHSKKEKPEFWFLSNMAGGMRITWRGMEFYSSEQLYQASKYLPDVECIPASATGPVEARVQKRILGQKNPRAAKMTQKCAAKAGLVRPDWERIMIDCMLWVLELKLRCNPWTFGEALKRTGNTMIVEKSRKDAFWGCLLNESTNTFEGENHLGRLLVRVRNNFDRIVKEGFLTHPEGFLVLPEEKAA